MVGNLFEGTEERILCLSFREKLSPEQTWVTVYMRLPMLGIIVGRSGSPLTLSNCIGRYT